MNEIIEFYKKISNLIEILHGDAICPYTLMLSLNMFNYPKCEVLTMAEIVEFNDHQYILLFKPLKIQYMDFYNIYSSKVLGDSDQ